MKKLIIIILMIQSTICFADNPIDQYCGAEQYGFLYRGSLYSLPNGLGWKYPQPPGATWEQTRPGYFGANVYRLQCDLDSWVVLVAFAGVAIYGYLTIKNKIKENERTTEND